MKEEQIFNALLIGLIILAFALLFKLSVSIKIKKKTPPNNQEDNLPLTFETVKKLAKAQGLKCHCLGDEDDPHSYIVLAFNDVDLAGKIASSGRTRDGLLTIGEFITRHQNE